MIITVCVNYLVEFDLKPEPKWFKVNDDSNGFYRVNYDEKNWKALVKQLLNNHEVLIQHDVLYSLLLTLLMFKVFSPSDRAGLLNDAFTFLRMGLLDVEIVFELLPYLAKETSYGPWSIASSQISEIELFLQHSECYLSYRVTTVQNLFEKFYLF